jgi:hypothetical protein
VCVLVLPPDAAAAGGGLPWPRLYPSHDPFGTEAIHNSLIGFLKFSIHLLSFFVHCQLLNQIYQSVKKILSRGLQRDVVYLGWPKAASHMSPYAGEGGELRGLSQWVQLYIGAQINFGDLTPYLKGLSHEIDFKNVDKNLQNLA